MRLDHLRIRTILFDEFAVCALFNDATLIDDDDVIHFEDSVKAMRNRDDCAR